MTPRTRLAVAGALLVALAGVVWLFVHEESAVEEVWRTERGETLHGEPGGAALDQYVLCPCSDPTGRRVDFVLRKRSILETARRSLDSRDPAEFHRLDETQTVVDVAGERWLRFVVVPSAMTLREIDESFGK